MQSEPTTYPEPTTQPEPTTHPEPTTKPEPAQLEPKQPEPTQPERKHPEAKPGRRLTRNASFWVAAFVMALCLWGSATPSLLYPVYAATWHLTPTVSTTVFAAYPLALVIMLFVAGGISDRIGRRATLLAGVAAMILSALAFVVATGLPWLYLGRLLQGLATGLALSAAGAALVDNDVRNSPARVSATTLVANAAGLTLGLVTTGALLQYAPLPRHLTYLVFLGLALVATALVALMPSGRGTGGGGLRIQPITVPPTLRRLYLVAAVPIAVVFSVGALFLSLGAAMVRDLIHTNNALVAGATLSVLTVALAATGLLLRNLSPHRAVVIGSVLAAVALGLLQWSAVSGSLALFIVTGVVAGVSYGLNFAGGLRLINHAAPAAHRSGMLAALYLAAYAAQGVVAVLAGLYTTAHGLSATLDLFVPVLALAALGGAVLGATDARRTNRT